MTVTKQKEKRMNAQTKDQERLQSHVDSIARDIIRGIQIKKDGDYDYLIEEGDYDDGDFMRAGEYLSDVLDIEFIVNSDKTYKSARILVAFGGPNIWINLQSKKIEGYWWGDYAESNIHGDFMRELDEYLKEIYSCI